MPGASESPSNAWPNERRQFVRLDTRLNLSYKIVGTAKLGKSLTKDISGGGVRFLAEHALTPGTRLEVTLRLPERDEPVRFLGEIVWSKPRSSLGKSLHSDASEVGLRFVEIIPAERTLIMQHVGLYTPPPTP